MKIVGLAILLLPITCVSGQEIERVFIPFTPVTGEALGNHNAEEVNRLMSDYGWTEAEAKKYVQDYGGEVYTFSTADFRVAFPNIAETDKQASFCSNSMMSGASRLVFFSPVSDNMVRIKASGCRLEKDGISCTPMTESIKYFFESPEYNFVLEDGVSFAEASKLLTIFRDDGIAGLPDWFERQKFGYLDVTSIGKSNDIFVLTLGEFFCRGCKATFKVRFLNPDGETPSLTLVGDPEGMCI